MIEVYQLTQEQANQLIGVECVTDMLFNPIQDANDNWIISQQEVELTTIEWVKQLPKIEFTPKEFVFPI
jgi:hypothetical protein